MNGNAYLELLRLLMPHLPMSREAEVEGLDDDSDDEDDQMTVGTGMHCIMMRMDT